MGCALNVAQRFERLIDAHRRPDGSRWTGQQLDEATGGVVARSYFTNLRKGRIGNPGYEKMRAIARAMGFPPEAWFDGDAGEGTPIDPSDRGRGIAGRVERLFDAVRNPKTGEPYANAEVARMTLGDLSEEDVKGIGTGAIGDPTVGQVAALASVFEVEPSYLLDRGEPPLSWIGCWSRSRRGVAATRRWRPYRSRRGSRDATVCVEPTRTRRPRAS
jgi:transcriptional regulator with XRE-family HTH domain